MTKKKKSKRSHDRPGRGAHRQLSSPGHSISSSFGDPDRKRRKRSRPEAGRKGGDAAAAPIVPHAIQWLEMRRMKVPDALRSGGGGGGGAPLADTDSVLRLLPGLRERERRALARHVERCMRDESGDGTIEAEPEGSDGEYDVEDAGPSVPGGGWPADVEFSNDYRWDLAVPCDIRERYSPPGGARRRAARPSRRVYFRRIDDPDHPAHGEFGLYCALDRAPPGSWLLDYVGHVTLGEDQDKRSDYVSDFGESGELACDAKSYGNEARFLNDFRNTGNHPNVEFNKRRDKNGEMRQGVYVKLEKDARGEGFDGVRRDEELLVSYGKAYWRSRVGSLTDFIWRMPGQPMPKGGKPTLSKTGC